MLQGDFTIWIVCSEQGFFISYIIHDLLQWFQKVPQAESLLAAKHRISSLWVLTTDIRAFLRLHPKFVMGSYKNRSCVWGWSEIHSNDRGKIQAAFSLPSLLVLLLLWAWCTGEVSRSPALSLVSMWKSHGSTGQGLCFTLGFCTDTELRASCEFRLDLPPPMHLFRSSRHLFQQLQSVWDEILKVRWFKSTFMSISHLL